jgi:hypothetical protein
MALTLNVAPMLADAAGIQINIVRDFRYHFEKQYRSEVRRLEQRAVRAAGTDEEGAISEEYAVLDEIRALTDEMAVVALYRIVELNTQAILRWRYKAKAKQLYRFDRMAQRLKRDLRLDVQKLPNFRSADELRLINNAIKHTRKVSPELATYPGWVEGQKLSKLGDTFERFAQRNTIPIYLESLAAAVIRGSP